MERQVDQHRNQRSFEEEKIIWELEQIIEIRTKQLQNQAIIEYLIKWNNLPSINSTWEYRAFIHMHPHLPKH